MPFIRNTGNGQVTVVHRTGVVAVDVAAVPAQPTTADVATGGSLAASTTFKIAVAAGTRWGPTTPSPVASQATAADASATHVVRVTIAQVVGAEAYHVFLSTDAAPKYVGTITEAQRAAAGCRITAMGVADNAGANIAGTVDVQVLGTGVQTTAAPFTVNNAYLPNTPTALDCGGYSQALCEVKLTPGDLRSVPSYTLAVFAQRASGQDWYLLTTNTLTFGSATTPGQNSFAFDLQGATKIVVLVMAIAGQGTSLNFNVTLA